MWLIKNTHFCRFLHAQSYTYPAGAIFDAQLGRAEDAAAKERERYQHEAQRHGETREQAFRLQVHLPGTPRIPYVQAIPKQQAHPAPTSQLNTSHMPVQEQVSPGYNCYSSKAGLSLSVGGV